MARRRPAAPAANATATGAPRDAAQAPDPGSNPDALQRKISDLVARRQYSQALRVREQALRRHPDWSLSPSEAQLWCLEGRLAMEQRQPKRAEAALHRAVALAPGSEALVWLARLRLEAEQPERALALLEEAFVAGQLAPEFTGAYLKLLLLQGQEAQVRTLIREQPRRFQSQQIHWAAGVLSLLEGNPAHARRQFEQMAAPASPGDHGAVWRAWAQLEAGDAKAAAAALQDTDHPACTALALDLAARSDQHPAALLTGRRHHPPPPELVLALELLHQLRRNKLLPAAELLLSRERKLQAVLPELAALRRPLLLLAGQQALERESLLEAIRCWRPIVDRPSFDPDLALRLYPLLLESDDDNLREAERLAGTLLSWVRRTANDAPADWAEPRLATTLARLHCWQADAQMRLGKRQQARRSVEQAHQLAPELAEVTGRRGMLAQLNGATSTAIPLLWQALEGGCRSLSVYEVLEETLASEGLEEERRRLHRQYGASFGAIAPPEAEPDDGHPTWLEALSQPIALGLASALSLEPANGGGGVAALRIFVDHTDLRPGPGQAGNTTTNHRKVTLQVAAASERWDALLAGLPPLEQVEARAAIVAAILRFCRRSGKALAGEITLRLLQLEGQAAASDSAVADRALRVLLWLHGLGLKRGESPEGEARRLLRSCPRPERLLPLALLELRLLAPTRPWQALVQELQRRDPQNPLLTLALATMERNFSVAYNRLSEQAFEQARRQQDREALAACRREEAWLAESLARQQARRGGESQEDDPEWQEVFAKLDLKAIFRRMAQESGAGTLSDADLEKMLPDFAAQARQAFARMNPEDFDFSGFDWEAEEPPPRAARRRRTFMDL